MRVCARMHARGAALPHACMCARRCRMHAGKRGWLLVHLLMGPPGSGVTDTWGGEGPWGFKVSSCSVLVCETNAAVGPSSAETRHVHKRGGARPTECNSDRSNAAANPGWRQTGGGRSGAHTHTAKRQTHAAQAARVCESGLCRQAERAWPPQHFAGGGNTGSLYGSDHMPRSGQITPDHIRSDQISPRPWGGPRW